MKQTTYADSGVNRNLGDEVSKILYNAAKQTWDSRKGRFGEVIVPFDDFSGIRAIDVSNLPTGSLMNIGFDGVGTKIESAERLDNHSSIAYDLFAMVCDDALVKGAEPVIFGSIIDFRSLGTKDKNYLEQVRQLSRGYVDAAKAADVAVINGETAELRNRVRGFGDFNYNWGATVVWFAKKDRLFTGKEIQNRDYLVGLREKGLRSNGFSLVTEILNNVHGENWQKAVYNGENLGELALRPSIIYSRAVVKMFGGYDGEPKAKVHGVSHITGGGLPEKLGRVLKPSGMGATIYSPFDPSDLMLYCQEKGNVADKEAYNTWCMGQGMIIITPEPDKVMDVASNFGIESKVMGNITSNPEIRIKNKGYNSTGDYLSF